MAVETLRARVARELDPLLWPGEGLSWTNRAIVALICVSTALVVLETEPTVYEPARAVFNAFEVVVLAAFALEYAARVWASVENPKYGSRWRYVRSRMALVDLFVIVTMMFTFVGLEGALLRLIRLFRLLRLAKLGAYSVAFQNIVDAISVRWFELVVSVSIAFGLLIVSASALYLIEGGGQPEAFGSVPRAMWWATATLTTVGYGDVVPLTPLGKFFATLTAVTGVGLIAMPAGILASAFSEAIQNRRKTPRQVGNDED